MSEKAENDSLAQGDSDSLIGVTVDDGRYEIVKLIGEGGMGRVFQARQISMNRMVALKILRRQLAADEQLVARFTQEAMSVSRLRHPNTITIYDYGQSKDGYLFMAMELLGGRSLFSMLRQEKQLALPRALHIMEQVCGAVGEAHGLGIIHRDLKPENIQIDEVGSNKEFAKVLDFGIAKIVHGDGDQSSGKTLTMAGAIFGTPHYMSPEQVHGLKVDHRTDVYSLGVILYELLAGEPPFDGNTPMAVMMAQASKPVPDIRQTHPDADVTDTVAELINRCLAKERDERVDSVETLIQHLREAQYQLGEISSSRVFATGTSGPLKIDVQRINSMPPEARMRTSTGPGSLPAVEAPRHTPAPSIDAAADAMKTPEHSGQLATMPPSSLHDDLEMPRRGAGIWIALVLVLLAVGGGVFFLNADEQPTQVSKTTAVETSGSDPVRVEITTGAVRYSVTSAPTGATVFLGDEVLGKTPLARDLPENTSTKLRLELEGHAPAEIEVDGSPAGPHERHVELRPTQPEVAPATAWLRIESDPSGAQVLVGEEKLGTTPYDWKPTVADEPVEVVLSKKGYQTARRKVELAPAGEAAVAMKFDLDKRSTSRRRASRKPEKAQGTTDKVPPLVPDPEDKPPPKKKAVKKKPEKKPEKKKPRYQKMN